MNLREQLLNSPKPLHQFHDTVSLEWLFLNRPNFLPRVYGLESSFVKIIESKKPWEICEDYWFTNNLIRDGIHGLRHACRVAIHSISLALQKKPNISFQEIDVLILIALLHDCRRINDNTDIYHGIRAAEWFSKEKHILPPILKPFSKVIYFAITTHNDHYEQIICKKDYQKFKFFVDVIKTADALDRYRFPREDWWLDTDLVVLAPNQQDMALAYDLALVCEKFYLKINDNKNSIKRGWHEIIKNHYEGR